jgi:hypothetical protein
MFQGDVAICRSHGETSTYRFFLKLTRSVVDLVEFYEIRLHNWQRFKISSKYKQMGTGSKWLSDLLNAPVLIGICREV